MQHLISITTILFLSIIVTLAVVAISIPAMMVGQTFGILGCALYPPLMYFAYKQMYIDYLQLIDEPEEIEQQ